METWKEGHGIWKKRGKEGRKGDMEGRRVRRRKLGRHGRNMGRKEEGKKE